MGQIQDGSVGRRGTATQLRISIRKSSSFQHSAGAHIDVVAAIIREAYQGEKCVTREEDKRNDDEGALGKVGSPSFYFRSECAEERSDKEDYAHQEYPKKCYANKGSLRWILDMRTASQTYQVDKKETKKDKEQEVKILPTYQISEVKSDQDCECNKQQYDATLVRLETGKKP
jgi:hypothetical protein